MATKVLVLENTEGITELLSFSFSADYDVQSVPGDQEALALLTRDYYPLLIFDVKDMEGIDFLCRVRKQSPQTEVIALADPDRIELGVLSLKYEASDFILKPVTGEALEITLERALKKFTIKKKLAHPSNGGEFFPSAVDSERLSAVKQVIELLSETESPSGGHGLIVSIHTRKGVILKTSPEHKKMFGNLEGKKSWDLFRCESMPPDTCPAAKVFKTGAPYILEINITRKDGEEIKVRLTAAPLFNHNDQVDLVLETMTILDKD